MADDAGSFIAADAAPQTLTQSAQERLRQLIARIEKLEEEKAVVAADIKEVYGEAKSTGFDTKVMRKVIALRKQDRNERAEQEMVMDLYLAALGEI
ncbi:MAG: DUF2312 domain-containing protein [Hyphomonadaceae bacterium]|jgi:uncharacterized protein (UPF0335 family)|nr:MAG: hypothetical protein FD160_3791 [Caulobacteraceae bacterium]MBT9444250.1 DUF2312 domain-containing protein [Hyphomonadaceae bacterium]TPW02036.1 MAG: hypothetical protein FD124_3535 [Alphaproteobacteria bacterium]